MQKASLLSLAAVALLSVLVPVLPAAQAPAAAKKVSPNPKDPLYQSKGDQHRAYVFPDGNGVVVPYRLFVPAKWTKDVKSPMMVILHSGNSVDVPFERGDGGAGVLAKVANDRGYIILSPQGYTPGPRFNTPYGVVAQNGKPAVYQRDPKSEQDVLYVTDLVAQEYNVDRSRIYLFSNSHGAGGVWWIAEQHPDVWAAFGVASGGILSDKYPFEHIKNLPLLVIHGDKDDTNSFDAAQNMANAAKAHGVDATFMPVKGGTHLEAWTMVFPQMLDFFDKHPKK